MDKTILRYIAIVIILMLSIIAAAVWIFSMRDAETLTQVSTEIVYIAGPTLDYGDVNYENINGYYTPLGENFPESMPYPVELRPSVLLDIAPLNQWTMGYPTGCEVIALAMMINHQAEADAHTLMSKMPLSHDPMLGFRGDPATPHGFTILPPALISLTEEYLDNAMDMTGSEIEDLKYRLNDNRAVVVWIRGWGYNVHALCLTGYDETGFFYNDPGNGSKDRFITYDNFYAVWNDPIIDEQLGVVYPVRMALSGG